MIDRGGAAVAAAEESAFGGTALDEPIDRVRAERLVAKVTRGPWWRSCGRPVTAVPPRSDALSSSARDRGDVVELRITDGQLTAATVGHELAHALAGVGRGHDEIFRAAYVDVVAVLDGAGAATALGAAFERFAIGVGQRCWPPPYRARGEGFVLLAV